MDHDCLVYPWLRRGGGTYCDGNDDIGDEIVTPCTSGNGEVQRQAQGDYGEDEVETTQDQLRNTEDLAVPKRLEPRDFSGLELQRLLDGLLIRCPGGRVHADGLGLLGALLGAGGGLAA